jgi:hypothetical protein
MRVNPSRFEDAGSAQEIANRFDRLLRRLHADHEFKRSAATVIPGKTGFGLEKHRIDGLRLELALEDQLRWSVAV